MPQVLIISNRLPVTVKRSTNGLLFETSMGGLSTGLSGYVNGRNNVWIGWPGIASDDLTETERTEIVAELGKRNCFPVFLTSKQIDEYYTGYSNSLLWPMLHSLKMATAANHERLWRSYRAVNKLFADVVVATAKRDATIWVHDYQLMLVAEYLHSRLPHNQIGFFLHTPVPTARVLAKLPESKRLLRSLLSANLIGLQTKLNVINFSDAIQRLGIATATNGLVISDDHTVRITDFPIGIDYQKYQSAHTQPDVRRAARGMRKKYSGLRIIAGVDRLDITKGFVERLTAYQTFLERNPKQRGNVVFVLVGAPSRSDVAAYQALAKRVDKLVADINRRYGNDSWQPVDYIKGLPFAEVTALFQLADVCFVTPLRDGMNLVAKEYVASKRKNGVLILSKTAGAAEELKDALLVDVKKPDTMVVALETALGMSKLDITGRFNAMQDQIAGYTIQNWAKDFMKTLQKPLLMPVVPMNRLAERKITTDYANTSHRVLFLDYDGVLSEYFNDMHRAKPTKLVLAVLKKLCADPSNTVYTVSGRSRSDLSDWLSTTGVGMVAEHGAFIREPGEKDWRATNADASTWRSRLVPILQAYADDTPYAFVEEKSTALVWHYRESPPYQSQKNLVLLKKELQPLLKQMGLKAHSGKKILEIKHRDTSKGSAVRKYIAANNFDFILAAGDDYTDETMFLNIPSWAHSLRVGSGITSAKYRVKNVPSMIKLLQKLADI